MFLWLYFYRHILFKSNNGNCLIKHFFLKLYNVSCQIFNQSIMKTLNVVAAIIKKDNKILATKRGYGEFIDMWEFPGGKIEPNETEKQALIREIKEELDCTIKPTKFALNLEYQYPTFYLKMSCFEAIITEGTPKLLEHNDARWLSKDELDDVNWIPADIEAVDYLKKTMED